MENENGFCGCFFYWSKPVGDKMRYRTKNLNLAAFLYASGLSLANTSRAGKEVYFEFTPKDKAEDLISKYFSDNTLIPPT